MDVSLILPILGFVAVAEQLQKHRKALPARLRSFLIAHAIPNTERRAGILKVSVPCFEVRFQDLENGSSMISICPVKELRMLWADFLLD